MTHIDLVPFALHRRWRLLSALRTWVLALFAVSTLSAAAITIERARLSTITTAVEAREQQYRPIVAKQKQIQEIQKQLASLKSRETIAYNLEDHHPVLTLLGTVGKAAAKTDGKLNLRTLQFDRTATHERYVTLTGQVIDHLALARFLATLRVSNLFLSVDPTWVKAIGDDASFQEFEIQCLF